MRVDEVMLPLDRVPVVGRRAIVKVAIEAMTARRLGFACIVDADGQLHAVLTDGDLRRMLLNIQKPVAALMADDALLYATTDIVSCLPSTDLREAVSTMGKLRIWDLPVIDADGRLVGALHLHPAVTQLLKGVSGAPR